MVVLLAVVLVTVVMVVVVVAAVVVLSLPLKWWCRRCPLRPQSRRRPPRLPPQQALLLRLLPKPLVPPRPRSPLFHDPGVNGVDARKMTFCSQCWTVTMVVVATTTTTSKTSITTTSLWLSRHRRRLRGTNRRLLHRRPPLQLRRDRDRGPSPSPRRWTQSLWRSAALIPLSGRPRVRPLVTTRVWSGRGRAKAMHDLGMTHVARRLLATRLVVVVTAIVVLSVGIGQRLAAVTSVGIDLPLMAVMVAETVLAGIVTTVRRPAVLVLAVPVLAP